MIIRRIFDLLFVLGVFIFAGALIVEYLFPQVSPLIYSIMGLVGGIMAFLGSVIEVIFMVLMVSERKQR